MVTRVVWCEATGVRSTEVSYFLSSLRPNARRIGSAIRGHWSIENGLHWVLDVVFREDARRIYDRTAAENVALLNRLALSLLRGDTGKNPHEKVVYLGAAGHADGPVRSRSRRVNQPASVSPIRVPEPDATLSACLRAHLPPLTSR